MLLLLDDKLDTEIISWSIIFLELKNAARIDVILQTFAVFSITHSKWNNQVTKFEQFSLSLAVL